MVSAIEECCDYAGKHGVHLALENHGKIERSQVSILHHVCRSGDIRRLLEIYDGAIVHLVVGQDHRG